MSDDRNLKILFSICPRNAFQTINLLCRSSQTCRLFSRTLSKKPIGKTVEKTHAIHTKKLNVSGLQLQHAPEYTVSGRKGIVCNKYPTKPSKSFSPTGAKIRIEDTSSRENVFHGGAATVRMGYSQPGCDPASSRVDLLQGPR